MISQGTCIFKKPLKKSRLLSKSTRTNSGRRYHQLRNFNKILEMQSIGGVGVDKMNWGKAQVRVFKKRNTENRRNNVHYKLRSINMVHLGAKNWKKLNENLYLEELTSLPSIEQAELSSQMSPSRKDTDVFFSLEIQCPR